MDALDNTSDHDDISAANQSPPPQRDGSEPLEATTSKEDEDEASEEASDAEEELNAEDDSGNDNNAASSPTSQDDSVPQPNRRRSKGRTAARSNQVKKSKKGRSSSGLTADELLRGVTMRPSGKWQAQLYFMGKSRYIGIFETRQKAAVAYEIARERLRVGTHRKPLTSRQIEEVVTSARRAAIAGARKVNDTSDTDFIANVVVASIGDQALVNGILVDRHHQVTDHDESLTEGAKTKSKPSSSRSTTRNTSTRLGTRKKPPSTSSPSAHENNTSTTVPAPIAKKPKTSSFSASKLRSFAF